MEAFLVFLFFWLIPSFIVAGVASKRGFSFWAYFVHSFLPSPFIALITLQTFNRYQAQIASIDRAPQDPVGLQAKAAYDNPDLPDTEQKAPFASETIALIEELARMKDKGIISQEEFESKKKQLLERL